MRKSIAFLFLIPVLLLLVFLPWQLRGEMPYPVLLFTYIESLLFWMLLFVGFLAASRRSRWSRVFFLLAAFVLVIAAGYRLWTGEAGLLAFVGVFVGAFVLAGYACIFLPPIHKRLEGEPRKAA